MQTDDAREDDAREDDAREEERDEIIQRAFEGGYFDEPAQAYSETPSRSREECAAWVEVYRRAKSLLGEWPIKKEFRIYSLLISARNWREFLRRTRFIDLVPDEMLDEVDVVDESGRIGDPAWLVNANEYARPTPGRRPTR